MRPDKAQKNKKSAHSLHQTRDLDRPPVAGIFNCRRRGRHPQVCWSLLPELRVVRRSRFQLPVIPSATEMGSSTEHTEHTEGQALWILSHSECSGYSVVFQGIPRLSKVIQTTNPPPRPHRFPGSLSFRTQMHSSNQPLQTATWSDLRGCGVKQETN